MTTVTFYTEGSRITGFDASGHSGYAREGEDIVCAAVTSTVRLIECVLNEVMGLCAAVKVNEKTALISLRIKRDRRHASGGNLLDLDLGIGLTVALTLAIALLGVILEDTDLLALAVLQNGGLHLGAGHGGRTDGGVVAVQDRQNLVEHHLTVGLHGQLLDDGYALSVQFYPVRNHLIR